MKRSMSVIVRFDKRKAFLRDGRWWSADARLERVLNESTLRWIQETGGPPLSENDQERGVAREMAGRLGGKVVLHLRSQSGRSTAFFLEQRQMTLQFESALPLSRVRGGGRQASS